jgi:hypothetical protein
LSNPYIRQTFICQTSISKNQNVWFVMPIGVLRTLLFIPRPTVNHNPVRHSAAGDQKIYQTL